LEAVIFSVDALLADSRADERLLAEAVWDLHCAGIRVAVVTSGHWPAVHRALRDLLGDGAVEVLVTGDEVGRSKPDPEVYQHALWQMGVRAVDAIAVEDSAAGLRAAVAAGLTTVVVTAGGCDHDFVGAAAVLSGQEAAEALSAHGCRRMLLGSPTHPISRPA
jgi:beta-phosphoglucomutase-like phosphatase (HAD superfamily)